MPWRTGTAMRFWRRRKSRRLDSLTRLLIELEQLAIDGHVRRQRASLHF